MVYGYAWLFVALFTIFFNLIGTHLRNSKWFSNIIRWIISIILFAIGSIFIMSKPNLEASQKESCVLLMSPLVLTSIDKIFFLISMKYQQRDFQFNTSFEVWLNQHGDELSVLDHIITVIMLFAIIGLVISSPAIAKQIY